MSKYLAEKWMSFALYISVFYLYCIFILYRYINVYSRTAEGYVKQLKYL